MKTLIFKLALLFCALLVIFIFLEPPFRKNLLRVPLRAQWNLETNFRPLSQISKKDILPKNYVALLGDSNAEGMGDWYLVADQSQNSPFHSANIIHERTGRDVVSLGSSGASPQRYLVGNLPAFYMYINKLRGFHLEKPQDIVVYFYEGNDFNDAFGDIRKRLSSQLDPQIVLDDKRFEDYLENVVLKNDLRYKRASHFHWIYNLQAANFVVRAGINFYKYLKDGPRFPSVAAKPGLINKIKVNGVIHSLPDELHSPGLELTDQQLQMGAYVFKKCFQFLKKEFPLARFGVVYVPAPVSVYEWTSDKVHIQPYEATQKEFDAKQIPLYSDRICQLIKNTALELNVPFIDTRPRLRALAKSDLLHGPYDWKHLNRKGYETLSEDVVLLLERMRP